MAHFLAHPRNLFAAVLLWVACSCAGPGLEPPFEEGSGNDRGGGGFPTMGPGVVAPPAAPDEGVGNGDREGWPDGGIFGGAPASDQGEGAVLDGGPDAALEDDDAGVP